MRTRVSIYSFYLSVLLLNPACCEAQEYSTPGFDDLWRPCQGHGCNGHRKFLYWAAKGQALMLAGDYDGSNFCFETAATTWMDRSARYMRPHEDSYDEVHEFMMVIYYKTLNYLALGKLEDATVECKRLNDWVLKSGMHPTTRRLIESDPLISSVMGLVYDLGGHVDDALLCYDEALRQCALNYRGLMDKHIPQQLVRESEMLFSLPSTSEGYAPLTSVYPAGRLIVMWNNGVSPSTLVRKHDFMLVGEELANNDELVQLSVDGLQDTLLSFYKFKEPFFKSWTIKRNGIAMKGELLSDLNWYAIRALQYRLKAPGIHIWKRGSNWSTLPHSVYLSIIPLEPGDNEIKFTLLGDHGTMRQDSVTVPGDGFSHFYMINTLESRPINVVTHPLFQEFMETRTVAPALLKLPEPLRVRR